MQLFSMRISNIIGSKQLKLNINPGIFGIGGHRVNGPGN